MSKAMRGAGLGTGAAMNVFLCAAVACGGESGKKAGGRSLRAAATQQAAELERRAGTGLQETASAALPVGGSGGVLRRGCALSERSRNFVSNAANAKPSVDAAAVDQFGVRA